MPQNRFLKTIIIVLLLINAGTLGFLLLRPHPGHPPPGGGRGSAAAFLHEALTLTDRQEDEYRRLRRQHHDAVEQLRDSIRGEQRELYRLLAIDSGAAAAPRFDRIAGLQRQIETVTFDHFREFRLLCTPAQQQRFDEIIGEALRRLAP